MHERSELGVLAERLAGEYLQKKGYQVIAYNYRKPWGEIDVIARNGEVVVFVEVKANRHDLGGAFNPEIRVNPQKMAKIIKAATLYLGYELKAPALPWRVDIISVMFHEEHSKASITHFKNVAEAFQ